MLYWKAWLLLLVVAAFNPQKIGTVLHFLCCIHIYIFQALKYFLVTYSFRFGCLGWLSYSENAHGDGHDKVGEVYHLQ